MKYNEGRSWKVNVYNILILCMSLNKFGPFRLEKIMKKRTFIRNDVKIFPAVVYSKVGRCCAKVRRRKVGNACHVKCTYGNLL